MQAPCPKCQSKNIRKSKRRGLLESVVSTVAQMRPYRCLSCDSRFFRRPIPPRDSVPHITGTSGH
jgi:hypothetical protein